MTPAAHVFAAALASLVLAGCATTGGPALDANGNTAAILHHARELRSQDRAAQAVAELQQTLFSDPDNTPLLGELGRALIASGDPTRALDVLANAFDGASPDPHLLNAAGVALDLLGNHSKARANYAAALKIAPDYAAPKTNFKISQRMEADERRAMASARPKPIKQAAKAAPAPKIVIVPEPATAPPFADRWRLL